MSERAELGDASDVYDVTVEPDTVVSFESSQSLYKVALPTQTVWTDYYDLAYQLATGMRLAEGEDDLDAEDRITAFGVDPRTVECIYCEEPVSYSRICEHHTKDHPYKRWNPAYYPEVYES